MQTQAISPTKYQGNIPEQPLLSSIDRMAGNLQSNINLLHMAVDTLANKLERVLKPSCPTAATPGPKPSEAYCSIAGMFEGSASNAAQILDTLQSIIDRIDL